MSLDVLKRIPIDTDKGDIFFEVIEGKLVLRLKDKQPLLDFKELFTSEEWSALMNRELVLGDWNPASEYRQGNIVSFLGSLWQSATSGNIGNVPDESSLFWRIIVSKGRDGISAEKIFEILGTDKLKMEITDNLGGVFVVGGMQGEKMRLVATVKVFFRDLSDRVLTWRWRRVTGGATPTSDNIASDALWDELHQEHNSQVLEIGVEDVVLPSTTFVCTANIDSIVLSAELRIE